jgi:hypothetical protein
VVQTSEKGHNFEPDTGLCTRCGMTLQEYQDHGKPPCPGNKGERPAHSPGAVPRGSGQAISRRRTP